jgi:hypothetical protein
MVFNVLLSVYKLFLLSLLSFFLIFIIRQLFIRRKILIFLYHQLFFLWVLVVSVGGGGVQNDGYERLKQFILLEQNNKLYEAKKNLQNYDSMLRIDLQEFKNSSEFLNYLKKHDAAVDKAEAVSIGWLFVVLSEIAMVCVEIMRCAYSITRKRLKYLW